MSGPWRIGVDAGACIGSGICAGVAPGHFRVEGGVAVPLSPSVDPDDAVVDAAESCPVEAISVRDADGRLLAPES